MESVVFPREESEEDREERWSDNWEDKDVEDTVTQDNLPERMYQDDLASGNPPQFTDKSRFPDFAIITDHARALRYRKLYRVNFVTNDGPSDAGTAIYSAQATVQARTIGERQFARRGYASSQFGETTACYDHERLAESAARAKVDWSASLDKSGAGRTSSGATLGRSKA